MSYKRITSLIHNWSHSFVSLMNYVDDGYVIDDLRQLVGRAEVDEVVIDPLARTVSPPAARTTRILKALGYFADALPRQMEGESVRPHELAFFQLRLTSRAGSLTCTAVATDDRGKQYSTNVVPP